MKKSFLLIGTIIISIFVISLTACPPPPAGDLVLNGNISITNTGPITTGTTLTADYTGTENVVYQWKLGSTSVGVNSHMYTPIDAGEYTVTVSLTGYISKTSPSVTVTGTPLAENATISISPSTSQPTGTELTATFEYTGDGEAPTPSYQWNRSGTPIVGATLNKYTPNDAGSYTVTAHAAGFSSITSGAVTVTNRTLSGNITISPTTDVKTGDVLKANYTGSEAVSYQWRLGSTPVGANSDTYVATAAGSYTVIVSAQGFNSKTSTAVSVTAVTGNASQHIDSGIEALEAGNIDSAIFFFDLAFSLAPTDPEAIVYSTLGRLAAIAVDPKVNDFMKNHLGLTSYPGTINSLIDTNTWMDSYDNQHLIWSYQYSGNEWAYWYDTFQSWWVDSEYQVEWQGAGYYNYSYFWDNINSKSIYTYELVSDEPQYNIYYGGSSPAFNVPEWFANTDMYKDSLIGTVHSSTTMSMLIFANLLDKNTNGLNALLDSLIDAVFGSAFNTAYNRIATLTDQAKLRDNTLALFGLDGIFEGDEVYIGKAELNMLFAAMRIVKASLEWVSAYDWNTDLNFLTTSSFLWMNNVDFEISKPASIPFRNNFLKDRNNGAMTRSKASFTLAINDAIAAYDMWIGANSWLPTAFKEELENFAIYRDALEKLRIAINSTGDASRFYITEAAPGGSNTYQNTASGALFGIHLGNFFTPGFFSINNLIETEGSNPVFYGIDQSSDEDVYVKITAKTQIDEYGLFGFMFKSTPITNVLLEGSMHDPSEIPATLTLGILPPDIAKIIWDWYH